MYRVQYKSKSKKAVWLDVRYSNGKVKYIEDLDEARHLMRRCVNSGYEAKIFDCTVGIVIERSATE